MLVFGEVPVSSSQLKRKWQQEEESSRNCAEEESRRDYICINPGATYVVSTIEFQPYQPLIPATASHLPSCMQQRKLCTNTRLCTVVRCSEFCADAHWCIKKDMLYCVNKTSWEYHRFPLLGLWSTRPSIPFTEACKILQWEVVGKE